MTQLASRAQLRMSFLRWALVTVPLVVLLGLGSGRLAGSGAADPWYVALDKPAFQPPGWAFPIAWTLLYIALGFALAIILQARGARGRGVAVGMFALQLGLNLLWSPLFFAAHEVSSAFWLILAMLVTATATTVLFAGIRRSAALLMLPYLAWLLFAATLNFAIDRMNPNAETLVPGAARTQISG